MKKQEEFVIEIMTITQLAKEYGACLESFYVLIEPIMAKLELREHVRLLSPKQVKMIVDFLGPPKIFVRLDGGNWKPEAGS